MLLVASENFVLSILLASWTTTSQLLRFCRNALFQLLNKEAPSPHEVRLTPLDTNPVLALRYQSCYYCYIINIIDIFICPLGSHEPKLKDKNLQFHSSFP